MAKRASSWPSPTSSRSSGSCSASAPSASGCAGLPVARSTSTTSTRRTATPATGSRYFRFTTDHKVIGVQYLVTAFFLFFTAGTAAMFMRFELAQPGIATSKELYNTIMSTHGAMMITVALISIVGGLGNYLVPIMVGARDMAFPKANALSYWMLPLATPAGGDQPAPRRLRLAAGPRIRRSASRPTSGSRPT